MEFQVEARNMEMRKAWQDKLDEEKEKLTRHHPGLVHHLRATIEATKHHKGGGYELRVVASVPNDTLVVKRKGEKIVHMLVDAFNTLSLQLNELQRKRRQTVKGQEDVLYHDSMGTIKSVFPDESYGFIRSTAGDDIYFHENSLKDTEIQKLSEGDEVRFGHEVGDQGPCAAWVKLGR